MLVWLVSSGSRTMQFSAALSIFAAMVIGFIHFFHDHAAGEEGEEKLSAGQALARAGKKTFFNTVDALEAGGKSGISVAVACGMAGIIAGCITSTGLASTLINAIVGLFGIAAALNGYLSKPIHPILRILLIGGGLSMMIPGTLTDVIGLAVIAAVAVFQKLTSKPQLKKAA